MLADQPEKRITSPEIVNQLERMLSTTRINNRRLFALFKAQTYPSEEEVKNLLQSVSINCRDNYGFTPLLHSVTNKNGDAEGIIRFLIQNGAYVNAKDNKGRNALHILSDNHSTPNLLAIIKLLIDNQINVNCKSKKIMGWNALHFFCAKYENENLIDIIRLLIESGIDVNCKDKIGRNAFHLLCEYYKNENLIDIIRLLLENEIDVNCINSRNGYNALHYLCQNYQKENLFNIIQLLIKNGIEVTSETFNYIAYRIFSKFEREFTHNRTNEI